MAETLTPKLKACTNCPPLVVPRRGHTPARPSCIECVEKHLGAAYVLLADHPQESGRYVLLGTSDLFDVEPPPNEFTALAEQHAWSAGSRTRMRAAPMATYAEAAERCEALIARVAEPLGQAVATA